MSYLDLSILEIHNALIEGKVTPLELVKESLKRAKEDTNNAFETILEKEAIDAALNLDESKKSSLLWGIPYSLKDNIVTKGILTTASSDTLGNWIPTYDATVYKKLKESGAILIGKNTMDELAMGGRGDTCHKGIIFNPVDPTHERMIGGSSSGSAASVASGVVPFSIGSDTGDSVRKPASYSGVVGIKPTWGRVSRYGLIQFADTLDTIGVFAKTINDTAIVMETISGKDDNDLTSSKLPVDKYSKAKANKTKRLAVIKEIIDTNKKQETVDLFNNLIEKLKLDGFCIDFINFDIKLLRAVYPTYMIVSCAEATSNLACLDGVKYGNRIEADTYEDMLIKTRSAYLSTKIKNRLLVGCYALNDVTLYEKGCKARAAIANNYQKIFESYDAVIVPSAVTFAPRFKGNIDRTTDHFLVADSNLSIQNFGGFPSLTLPMGNINNLPIGLNVTTNLFEEEKLFEISLAIEEVIKK